MFCVRASNQHSSSLASCDKNIGDYISANIIVCREMYNPRVFRGFGEVYMCNPGISIVSGHVNISYQYSASD